VRADELFIHTLDDLEDRVRGPLPEYRLLGIAGLLRKLLIDDNPLVDQVNRHHRRRLTFVVSDSREYEELVKSMGATFMTAEDGIDPVGAPPGFGRLELNRSQFLKHRAMLTQNEEISVADLIQHGANVAGAVHLSNPRKPTHKEISKWAGQFSPGGYPAGTRSLQAIGRVVLRTLEPLRAAVMGMPATSLTPVGTDHIAINDYTHFGPGQSVSAPFHPTGLELTILVSVRWKDGTGPLVKTADGAWSFVQDFNNRCAYSVGGQQRLTHVSAPNLRGRWAFYVLATDANGVVLRINSAAVDEWKPKDIKPPQADLVLMQDAVGDARDFAVYERRLPDEDLTALWEAWDQQR
jgi:hypothetical protein